MTVMTRFGSVRQGRDCWRCPERSRTTASPRFRFEQPDKGRRARNPVARRRPATRAQAEHVERAELVDSAETWAGAKHCRHLANVARLSAPSAIVRLSRNGTIWPQLFVSMVCEHTHNRQKRRHAHTHTHDGQQQTVVGPPAKQHVMLLGHDFPGEHFGQQVF